MHEDIGQLLLDAQLIDANALSKAQQQQKNSGGTLSACLVKVGAVTEEALLEFLAQTFRTPHIDLRNYEPDVNLTRLVPGDVAIKFMALPVSRAGRRLVVAMANPTNIFAIDDIKFITGYDIEPRVASEGALKKAIDRAYDSAGTMADVMKGIEEELSVVEEEEVDPESTLSAADEAPIVKLVNSLIADAVRKGASDIHIEPYEKSMRVRFRIDGVMQEMMAPPFKFKAAIISRLKIMAELDIAERRVPQDGRIKIKVLNRTIDLRVSSLLVSSRWLLYSHEESLASVHGPTACPDGCPGRGKDTHHWADLPPIGTCPKMLNNRLKNVLRRREVTQIAHGQGFPVQSSNTARAVAPGDSCSVDKFI